MIYVVLGYALIVWLSGRRARRNPWEGYCKECQAMDEHTSLCPKSDVSDMEMR